MNTPTNPDVPFERQMLYILRSYQRLQKECLVLRADNRKLAMRLLLAKQDLQRNAVPFLPDTLKTKNLVRTFSINNNKIQGLIEKLSEDTPMP